MRVGEIEVLPVLDGFGYEVARDVLLRATFANQCTLAPGLDARSAAGHTPGSTIYILSSGNQRALLLGDVAHSVVELTEPGWEFVFDVDRAAARAVRERITADLLDSQDPAAPAHFPAPQFGRLVRAGKAGREWIFC